MAQPGKVTGAGTLEERIRALEDALNYRELLLGFTAVTGEDGDTSGGGGVGAAAPNEETPTGVINGSNAVFTLTGSPTRVVLFKNGLHQRPGAGNDYQRSGAVLTYEPGNVPTVADSHFAYWWA